MVAISDFRNLVGRRVNGLFVVLWPPLAESRMLDVSLTVALEFDDLPSEVLEIKIGPDGQTPVVAEPTFGQKYDWHDFIPRVAKWMNEELDNLFGYEAYDGKDSPFFSQIIGQTSDIVELITLVEQFEPFAVKLVFQEDYLIVSSTAYGSTVETKAFNQLDNLDISFGDLGKIVAVPISHPD